MHKRPILSLPTGLLFLLPAGAFVVTFILLPFFWIAQVSFTNRSLTGRTARNPEFVGFDNYLRLFDPDRFLNSGEFGSSPRNIIIGPGSKNLNMNFNRQVRLGGNRTLQIQTQVSNLLNLANYSGVDTNVNSPTFGQIRSISGQRRATLNLRFGF